MKKRLEILKSSLEKKEADFNAKLSVHMEDVRGAQGEPMAGHRGGERVLRRWDKQHKALKSLNESIEKTKLAIEREEYKIAGVAYAEERLPPLFLRLRDEGVLNQWQKHPNIFFVDGIDKARIGWDEKKKTAYHKFYRAIECPDQREKFKKVWAVVFKELNEKKEAENV